MAIEKKFWKIILPKQKNFKENLKFRFRNYKQYNTVALANHLEYKTGNKNLSKSQAVYMRPYNRGEKYITRNLNSVKKSKQFISLYTKP